MVQLVQIKKPKNNRIFSIKIRRRTNSALIRKRTKRILLNNNTKHNNQFKNSPTIKMKILNANLLKDKLLKVNVRFKPLYNPTSNH